MEIAGSGGADLALALFVTLLGAGLVGDSGMFRAVGHARLRRLAAEMEIRMLGIADRPFAHALGQGEDRGAPRRLFLDRRRTAGQSEAVSLADYRVAGDVAKGIRDLARAHTLAPELLQLLYPLVSPTHALSPLIRVPIFCGQQEYGGRISRAAFHKSLYLVPT